MPLSNQPVFNRSDTFLGVCEAIGQDFGFNPNWLRVALSIPVLWNPVLSIAVYLALGIIVLVSRLLFPAQRKAVTVEAAPRTLDAGPVAKTVAEELQLPIAA